MARRLGFLCSKTLYSSESNLGKLSPLKTTKHLKILNHPVNSIILLSLFFPVSLRNIDSIDVKTENILDNVFRIIMCHRILDYVFGMKDLIPNL